MSVVTRFVRRLFSLGCLRLPQVERARLGSALARSADSTFAGRCARVMFAIKIAPSSLLDPSDVPPGPDPSVRIQLNEMPLLRRRRAMFYGHCGHRYYYTRCPRRLVLFLRSVGAMPHIP